MRLVKRLLRLIDKKSWRRYWARTYLPTFPTTARRASANSGPLERLYYDHQGRETTKWHHYLPIYESEIERFRGGAVRLLEIGVQRGGSLQVWRKYFGDKAVIFGIDVDPACAALDTPDLPVRIGSQRDPEFLRDVVAEMGGLDVVVDDGSHIGADQIASFTSLFPQLSFDGVYIVEDVHTAYWYEFKGGIGREGTVLSFTKDLIDDMNGWYHGNGPQAFATAKDEVGRISFYDGMIVIRKARRSPPEQFLVGGSG